MRKVLALLLAGLLLVSLTSSALATKHPASAATEEFGRFRGATGTTPPTRIVKVRYSTRGANYSTIESGDVVVWDTNSADGFSVSSCVTDGDRSYAGVLVTDILTAENNGTTGTERNWGYMAIEGYCLANCDTSLSTVGMSLVVNGATREASFKTSEGDITTGAGVMSSDIGVLLKDTAVDGLMPVWLR